MLGAIKRHRKLFVASVTILFLSFVFNVFGMQSMEWFGFFQKDSNALVVHKLACFDEQGGDRFAGMLVMAEKPDKFSVDDKSPVCQKEYSRAYVSQFGLQGKLSEIGALVVHDKIGVPLRHYLTMLKFGWALLTALVLALFVVWVADKFARFTAITVLLLLAMSVWVVGFARNMYWATPLMFLPMIYALYYYQKPRPHKQYIIFLAVLLALFFVRFLNGYEFVPEIILAPVAVVGYYAYLKTPRIRALLREAIPICLVGAVAFIGALSVNFAQVYSYTGDVGRAKDLIAERILLRTGEGGSSGKLVYNGLGNTLPAIYSGLSNYIDLETAAKQPRFLLTNIISTINYAFLPVVNIPVQLKEPLYTIISSFVVVALAAFLAMRNLCRTVLDAAEATKYRALRRAMWLGLFSALAWLVLARGHVFVHAHLNGIIYYLPFLLFAYIALGEWLRVKYDAIRPGIMAVLRPPQGGRTTRSAKRPRRG